MAETFGKPVVTQEAMRARIRELGQQISEDYQGKDLVVVGVLKGAYVFFADLVRVIQLPIQIDFLIAQGTRKVGRSSKTVKVWTELTEKVTRRHVLLVEDIVDSGLTAKYLVSQLQKHRPASVEICTLLSKSANREIEIDVKYVGFEVPKAFIVGYGLDFEQKYRNLPYLAKMNSGYIPKDS